MERRTIRLSRSPQRLTGELVLVAKKKGTFLEIKVHILPQVPVDTELKDTFPSALQCSEEWLQNLLKCSI